MQRSATQTGVLGRSGSFLGHPRRAAAEEPALGGPRQGQAGQTLCATLDTALSKPQVPKGKIGHGAAVIVLSMNQLIAPHSPQYLSCRL